MKYKHKRKTADYFIKYDNSAPTSYVTLAGLGILMVMLLVNFTNIWLDGFIAESEAQIQEMHFIQRVEAAELEKELEVDLKEQDRQDFLAELRHCESTGNDLAAGDGGRSIGPYQWQKATLEDALGRKVTYAEYYDIVTDFETIHPITYETYFIKKEGWRWKNCTAKIMKQKAWNI